jgi:hypothetical protein
MYLGRAPVLYSIMGSISSKLYWILKRNTEERERERERETYSSELMFGII